MTSQEFTVLYTHQKMKKSKTWQDGILRIRTGGNKAILFDDKAQCLESIFIKSQVNAGDNLESERYLITVEAVKLNEKSSEDQPRKAETTAVNRNVIKPGGLPLRHLPVGLKRKFTGFQGPRQVEKKIPTKEDEEKATILPLSKQCQGSFPSKFYITSPLFSTICKKDADTNLSTNFHEDVYTNNDKEHESFTSLVSAPFLDICKETEKRNSDQSVVKPEHPLITEHTKTSSHVAVSQNIRSTAQIIALLKSKPAQLCREQATSDITGCHSRFQTSENVDSFHDRKSITLPGFSGNPDKGLTQNIQHQHFTKETGSDKREWNAEMLLSSAEQPCDKEVAGQRHDRKANNLSQDLQDPCSTKTLHPEKMCACMNLTDSKGQCTLVCERYREPSFSRSEGVPKPLSINRCAANDQPNSCILSESSISKMNSSEFVSSLSDISFSASPAESIAPETNPSTCREHSVANGLIEDSSVKSQNELQPRRNSETVSSDLELSADVVLTGLEVVKEELGTHGRDSGPDEQVMEINFNLLEAFDFNDTDNKDLCERDVKELVEGDMLSQGPACLKGKDAAQTVELRLHSSCEVMSRSKKEVKGLIFDGENDRNRSTGGIPLLLCDNNVGNIWRTAEDSVSPTRIEMELLDDRNKIKETSESRLNIEASTCKKDLDDCAANTINEGLIKSKDSDLLPSGTNINEGHAETNIFEKTESNSCISSSRMISAMDKRTAEEVLPLGCTKSQYIDLEHFQGTSNDGIKPGSPFPAFLQKSDTSCGSFEYIVEDQQNVFDISYKEDTIISRSAIYLLGKGHSSSEETEIGETEFENIESINSLHEACEGERIGMDCVKCTAFVENSSELPDLVNNIALLRALTEHSTALESLQKIQENSSLLYEAETSKEIFEPLVRDKAIKQLTEMSYSGSRELSSCSYLDSSGLTPLCVDNILQKPKPSILPAAPGQGDCRTFDCQPKSPHARNFHEDDTNFTAEGNFQKKSNIIKESIMDETPLALGIYSEIPKRIMSGSLSHSDLVQTQWTSWEPSKMISSVPPASSLNPDSPICPPSRNEETIEDIQEPLIDRIIPIGTEPSECFFTWEESSYPEQCNLSRFKPTVKTRAPLVTVPATGKIPDAEVYLTDCDAVQQSVGSSVVNLRNKSAVFPISAFGPEDRNYETSVFEEHTEDGQRESIQPMSPNVTSQYRQSKWLKYQNSAQCDLISQNSDDVEVTEDIWAENILGMPLGDTGESQSSAMNKNPPGSVCLRMAKSMDLTVSELSFPNVDKVKYANVPKRKIAIPTVFQSHVHYKQIFTAALTEHLNIILFELSQRLHKALSKVDISFYTSLKDGQSGSKESRVPLCDHMLPAKLVVVKKEGQNKGRLFYTCDAPKAEQCSFFKWIEEVNPGQIKSRPGIVLHDVKSIGAYLRSQKISFYEGCQLLVRKAFEIQTKQFNKLKKFMNTRAKFDGDSKSKLYLKLSRKEHSSVYSKDDIWVVSKTLNFDPLDTFIASSAFFGPSSNNEVELLPLKGYCPSNWQTNMLVHALLVCNASGELTSLRNMEEYFNPLTLPLIPYLLKMNFDSEKATKKVNKRRFIPPASNLKCTMMYGLVSPEITMALARKMIQTFSLNPDQATSLIQIAGMMTSHENVKPVEEQQIFPITIIHGVFGAGKSYLLSVVILFLVQLFESSEAKDGQRPVPWKLLIASSTNVAVDRILLGLLDLGFESFIRVGSIRKIAKPILPYSLHAGSGNENEQLKELLALMKEDLTPVERIYVRKSIEQHKLGTNKAILQQVKVVGVTCAACPFSCMNTLKFPVVVLDECSQMTEPASLLPIARFQCEKLVLVGDPKQLPPTIQGSDSVHEKGLEQTLFDRLSLMGHKAILLRTQYRCHPAISAIANELFYEGILINGVSEEDRSPLLDWLPTLCFYSVSGMEQIERDNSFYNMAEAHFTVKLIQCLIASGVEGSAIGVITLYKSQMCKIQNLLSGVHSEALEIKAVQVSTVDAFQGAEKEIIVLSCVRTRQVGFIDSEKRMNVALTRAKRHLLIVGNLACLSKNRLWGRVIHHCKGWENGLQHVSQCEQQLNNILKCYSEKNNEEKDKKKEN
ncbi:5'-3' DNA helicase ZGRF1 isoform X3 [Dromaius novaehollandiae]|uniref:5'-3' DNA helicase ZGRF1 isoform X3 n=1 Tax=Dromaius novaehollandiae TaxID=8790 RepID=UPI00311F417A